MTKERLEQIGKSIRSTQCGEMVPELLAFAEQAFGDSEIDKCNRSAVIEMAIFLAGFLCGMAVILTLRS